MRSATVASPPPHALTCTRQARRTRERSPKRVRRPTGPPSHSPVDLAVNAPTAALMRFMGHRVGVGGYCGDSRNLKDLKEHGVAQRGGGFGGGQPNMQQLMKQAQKMQEQLAVAQAELAAAEVTGSAGGGLVTATLTGSGELTAVTIDPQAVDPDDVETLQDLIIAAVRDAHRLAEELAAQKMGPVTGGMGGLGGLGLPGF